MGKTRIISIITFLLILTVGYYISFGIYQHRVEMAQLEIVKNDQQEIAAIKGRMISAWQDYLNQTIDLKNKVHSTQKQPISQSLNLIEGSRDDIIRAFYITKEMIYLKQWSKKINQVKEEVFGVGVLDFSQFKLAEIMEFRDQNYAGAITIYEKLWLENPDDSYATNALARCLYKQDDYERALKLYRQIYNQNPPAKLQDEIPLGLTAGLQIVNIYDQQGNSQAAGIFGLNVYEDLQNSKWELSEIKYEFYIEKIKAWLNILVKTKSLKRTYRKLQEKEKLILADKKYISLIENKVIPFIEGSYSKHYYIYFNNRKNTSKQFLIIIPNHSNFLVLEIDFLHYLKNAIDSTIVNIEREKIEIGIENKKNIIKPILKMNHVSSMFSITEDFPELKIKLSRMKTVVEVIDEETDKIMKRYLIATIIMMVILGLFFIVFYNQIRLAEKKTEFVSQVSHELKTPLTSLRAFSELIQDQPDLAKEKIQQYAAFMQTESMRLARLIENLFDITRIEKKKLHYTLVSHDLSNVVDEAVTIFKQINDELTQTIIIETNETGKVMVDKDAFIRVMLNLLDNAKKYSRIKGMIKVRIMARHKMMVIEVEDDGVGMRPSELRNVFKKYYQAKRTYEEKFKGVGLGLPIVKTIVRAHHGNIKIESEINKGTCVKLTLPKLEDEVERKRRDS